MRAPQLAAVALGANALLGLGLELSEVLSEHFVAAGIGAFVILDIIALAALVAYRRDDEVSPIGLGLWAIGIAASVYNSIWVIQLLLGSTPSYHASDTAYYVEMFARAGGQLFIVVNLASVPRGRRLHIAAFVFAVLTIVGLYLFYRLLDGAFESDDTIRKAREIVYSASLIVLGYAVLEADRLRRDREPPAARVVS